MDRVAEATGTGGDGPLVSVLMPAYNHARYVETSVRSVLGQDWPRVELIVVDDGSTDGTWRVLEGLRAECEQALERVVMERQENAGTCVTLNRLRAMARGEYVAVLASDDAFLPGAFGILAAALAKDPSVGVVVGRNEFMDGEGRRCFWDDAHNAVYERAAARYADFDDFLRTATGVDARSADFGSYRALVRLNHVPNGALIRRSVLERIPPFTREAPMDDWWLHLQLSKITGYAAVAEPVFRYRCHATNTIRKADVMNRNYWRTVAWEERLAESLPDGRWLDALRAVHWSVRRRFGLGRWLALEKRVKVRETVLVLVACGREHVLARHPRKEAK